MRAVIKDEGDVEMYLISDGFFHRYRRGRTVRR